MTDCSVRRGRTAWLRRRRGKRVGVVLAASVLVSALGACSIPNAPSYPYWGPYGSRQGVIDKASSISTALETYVKGWLDGTNSATIPDSLLPDGRDRSQLGGAFVLKRPNEINTAKQWIQRPSQPIDVNSAPGAYPDPNALYLLHPHTFVPFGSKVLIDGKFPKSRMFDIQMTPSFQPEQYHYALTYGVAENPIVDADIAPKPGSSNPFRVGANRNATNRDYQVTYEMKVGNAAQTDPGYRPPFRHASNTRSGTGLVYTGPWGDPAYPENNALINKRGLWDTSEIWVRYYAPDKATNGTGGVPLPKITYQLPDGRQFYIETDLTAFNNYINKRTPIPGKLPADPGADEGPTVGWYKDWGIIRNYVSQDARINNPNDPAAGRKRARDLDKGANGREESLPAPQNYESGQTLCTYCTYFTRNFGLGWGKVAVLTGRLPTTPKTRNGEATMTAANLRYISVCTYSSTLDGSTPVGQAQTCLMDDEIVTDANGYYTIVYSRPEDRPANATKANGVTWVNWGPDGTADFRWRWMSVGPEWTFAQSPDETHLGRASDWASESYNPNLIGKNNRTGWMGHYLPNLHYMDKSVFANLGTNVRWNQIPIWTS
jgi:hypothetical protein